MYFLRDGESGGNGVYVYGAGGFPTDTFQSTNYWVDVVFTTSAGGSDTTPPTVTATTPLNGATGVNVGTTVTATFSEPMAGVPAKVIGWREDGEPVTNGSRQER